MQTTTLQIGNLPSVSSLNTNKERSSLQRLRPLLLVLRLHARGRKLPQLVAHHPLGDLYAPQPLVARVHEEHAAQEVWQDHGRPAGGADDGRRRGALEARAAPPLRVLPSEGDDVLEQADGDEGALPGCAAAHLVLASAAARAAAAASVLLLREVQRQEGFAPQTTLVARLKDGAAAAVRWSEGVRGTRGAARRR